MPHSNLIQVESNSNLLDPDFTKPIQNMPFIRPEQRINGLGQKLLVGCLFFLLPTAFVLFKAVAEHLSLSSLVMHAWEPASWFPHPQLVSKLVSKLALNLKCGYLYLLIGFCAWVYYQGFRYFQMMRYPTVPDEKKLVHSILKWTALCSLVLAFVIPFHSWDLYAYINYGAEQAFYGLNPYRFPVTSISGWEHDVLFHPNWAKYPCNYGLTFIMLSKWLLLLSSRHFGVAFVMFKLLNVSVHVALTALIYRISKALTLDKPWLSAYLYGWNPLILFQAIANGHNDILMVLPIMVSFWLLCSVKRFQWLHIPLWVLGILVKYAVLPALPFLILYLIQVEEFSAVIIGLGLSLLLAVNLFLPFRDIIGNIPTDKNLAVWYAIKIQHSFQEALCNLYSFYAKIIPFLESYLDLFQKSLGWILMGLYAALGAVGFRQSLQSPVQPTALIRITAAYTAILICVVSPIFHAWYIALFFPFMMLLPENDRLRQFGLVLSVTELLAFTNLERANIMNILMILVPFLMFYGPFAHHFSLLKRKIGESWAVRLF
jgi:alpha-1,6-mannosyltransferase